MRAIWNYVAAIAVLGSGIINFAQSNSPTINRMAMQSVSFDTVLNRSLKTSSLTFGGKPFHAIIEIGSPGDNTFSGHVEAWWISEKLYRIEINSPAFRQSQIVNENHVQVRTEGDYYPRWLENFVQGLLDPAAVASNFTGRNATSLIQGSQVSYTYSSRDDRTNGITDPMTVGKIEFRGPDYLLLSTSMFNHSMRFSDWEDFEGKQVPRTYETKVLDNRQLIGKLVALEKIHHPDLTMFYIEPSGAEGERTSTKFISTAEATKLLEAAPSMDWPPVREGRTDGYMIVFARTDRTGHVRETAEYSSDNLNEALQKYGMEQALKYKFKPLIVDGLAMQFETPLVLHFISRIDNPIPILNVDEMKRQILSCSPSNLPKAPLPSGNNIMHCRIAVDEKGKFWGFVSSDMMRPGEGALWGPALNSLKGCTFKPYVVNGQPTFFKGDMELVAQ